MPNPTKTEQEIPQQEWVQYMDFEYLWEKSILLVSHPKEPSVNLTKQNYISTQTFKNKNGQYANPTIEQEWGWYSIQFQLKQSFHFGIFGKMGNQILVKQIYYLHFNEAFLIVSSYSTFSSFFSLSGKGKNKYTNKIVWEKGKCLFN